MTAINTFTLRKAAAILGSAAIALFILGGFGAAQAQIGGPNSQLLCYTLQGMPRFSPGLNRGAAENEWILCQAVIDGSAFDDADAGEGVLGDGDFKANFVVPTYTDKNKANGINNLAILGTFGGGLAFTDIAGVGHGDSELPPGPPTAHPALTEDVCGTVAAGDGCLLGAFGDGDKANMAVSVAGAPVFSTGPNLFPNGVTGVRVPITMSFVSAPTSRIDLFFAIRLARDHLKRISNLNGGPHQGFPGEMDGNGGSPDGAAQYFSGPGPLWIGFFTGDPTGVATVPIKVLEGRENPPEPEPFFSFIDGSKFCDANIDGSCGGEHLVNGTVITVKFCLDGVGDPPDGTCGDVQTVNLTTGADWPGDGVFSQADVEISKSGPNFVATVTPLPGTAGNGEYSLSFTRDCSVNGQGDGGAPLILEISETIDPIFDLQTAPVDDPDDSDGITASGGVYTVSLGCTDEKMGLDFGNVAITESGADPMTQGFWGQLVKKAIHSQGESAECEVPGEDVLPHSGFNTPAEVAEKVNQAVAMCEALETEAGGDPDAEVGAALCWATSVLPPGNDDSINNDESQLLAFMLNIKAGKLPGTTLIDPGCVGLPPGDLISASELAALACGNFGVYTQVLAFINELDPFEGETQCLFEPTCPDDPKVTGSICE